MANIEIPRNDYGKVRLFALSLSDEAAVALQENSAGNTKAQLLGADNLDDQQIEVIRVADLGAMGLAGYLRAGVDANEAEITRDATRLAALDGWVMLVHSAAFGGAEATLSPAPELTLIGTYALTQADQMRIPLESDAAEPYSGVPSASAKTPPKGRAGGSLVVVGVAVLVVLILWWAFS